MRKARRKGDRLIEFAVSEVFVFIKQTFLFPRLVNCATAGLKEGKKLSGEALSPGFRSWCLEILQKITPASQDNSQRLEPPIQAQQTQSVFHRHAQRSAFRRRDVRPQSR